jgi:hypothetical protein
MKNLFKIMLLAFVTISLANCGGGGVQKSKEMEGFCAAIKGTSADVTSALKTYGNAGLDAHDMDMFNLSEPNVTAANGDCYTTEFKAGMTTRTYDICWEKGKIAKITDKGVK